ncbi:MAG: efflux RND transporter periplasmic adaptor subunit [Pirellulaceae bacterium]
MCKFDLSTPSWSSGCLMVVVLAAVASQSPSAEIEGFTEPYRDIDVAASEMGRVISLEVREGDRVTTGRLLARLDEEVLNAMLKIAKADMESAGRLEAAQAELRMHQESFEKLEGLLQRNHATQREVDRARAQKEMAEARVKATQEELAVKSLEYARTQAQLAQRRVSSPIDGVVTRVYKDPGEFVSPNDPVLVKVVQLDPLLIVFSVPAAEARKLAAEETVRVRIESAAKPVEGVVEFVSPMGDAQSGTMRVSVRIPNPDERVPSGTTCHLLLPGDPATLAKAAESP